MSCPKKRAKLVAAAVPNATAPRKPTAGPKALAKPANKSDDARINFTIGDMKEAKEASEAFDADEIAEPLASVTDAMHLVLRRMRNLGLDNVGKKGGVKLKIGTMCSGTDAPIFALRQLTEAAVGLGIVQLIDVEHKFSVEIEAFKQSFIQRNIAPTGNIFRDVTEMHFDEA